MAQPFLKIVKNWFTGTTVREPNWDAIRSPLLTWSTATSLNINQIAQDAFGSSYILSNTGAPALAVSLQDQINNIISGGASIIGTTNATWTIHLGSGNRAILDTAGLTGVRTFTFPDATQVLVGTTAVQTLTNKTLVAPIVTGGITFSSGDVNIWDGNDLRLYSDAGVTLKGAWDGATGDITAGGVSATSGIFTGNLNVYSGNDFRCYSDAGTTLVFNVDSVPGSLSLTSSVTTTNSFSIQADSLTSGRIMYFASNSADNTSRDLVYLANTNVLAVGANILRLIQQANAPTLFIDAASSGENVFQISAANTTTGNIISIQDANSLTTGAMVDLVSNSSDASSRWLFRIKNDNSSASSTDCLLLQQDSANRALRIEAVATCASVVTTGNSASRLSAMDVNCDNAGIGGVLGIDLSGFSVGEPVLSFVTDAVDPTGGGGAATGRIAVLVGGSVFYLAYY